MFEKHKYGKPDDFMVCLFCVKWVTLCVPILVELDMCYCAFNTNIIHFTSSVLNCLIASDRIF